MPYNVLIVDDEPLARAGLRTMYDWSANDFQVVGEASDGRKALQFMERQHADIVIADISMPMMDGLEFAKAALQRHPGIKLLLLTCHNDFDYVREAMRLGASDYLLKATLEAADLHRSLQRMRKELVHERRIEGERGLTAALDGFGEWKAAAHEAAQGFVIAVCSPISPAANADEPTAIEMIAAMSRLFYQMFPGSVAVRYGGCQLVARLSADRKSDAWESMTRLHQLWENERMICTIGLSERHGSPNELRAAYLEAMSAHSREFFEEPGRIYTAPRPAEAPSAEAAKLHESKNALHHALSAGFIEKAYESLLRILSCWEQAGRRDAVLMQAKQLIQLLLSIDSLHAAELSQQLEMIDRFRHLDELKAHILCLFDRIYSNPALSEDYYGKMIAKAIEYITNRFHNDISLSDVAAHVAMSKNYFSELFKKHTGLTFTEYITAIRMNNAKRMLHGEQCKIYEVAERCGFQDVKHFSKQFKKVFGQSPKEFQGKLG
jgi:two-component system, response regulator YesN